MLIKCLLLLTWFEVLILKPETCNFLTSFGCCTMKTVWKSQTLLSEKQKKEKITTTLLLESIGESRRKSLLVFSLFIIFTKLGGLFTLLYSKQMGKQWKQGQTIFWGSKISADGDCSHEIRRRLLLRRKVMTNLDRILKSRDITLQTKVHLVKAMVFPVVMYGCESWTIKKAERQRIDAFELWCWRRLLRVPWTVRRSNQSILKEISPGCSLEGLILKLKLQYFGHLM